jgi:hypothetical protein
LLSQFKDKYFLKSFHTTALPRSATKEPSTWLRFHSRADRPRCVLLQRHYAQGWPTQADGGVQVLW